MFAYLKNQGAKEFDSSQPPPQRSSKKKSNTPVTQDISNK